MTQTAQLPSRTGGAAAWELTVDEARRAADLLDAIKTVEKTKAAMDAFLAFAHAELQELTARQVARSRVGSNDADFAYRSMAAEVAVATNVSQHQAAKTLAASSVLVDRYPKTHQALRDGVISSEHARVIADVGQKLTSPDLYDRYERLVLEHAVTETVFHTRQVAKTIVAKLEPDHVEQRCEQARARRTVWVEDRHDGMAEIGAYLPADLAHGIFGRVRDMARGVMRANRASDEFVREMAGPCSVGDRDERSVQQVRADVFADLLLTGTPAGHAAHEPCGGLLGEFQAKVQVTIPVETLTGENSSSVAVLETDTIIHPDHARHFAKHAKTWERIFIRPDTGDVITTDTYRPTAEQRRAIQVRDQTCRFPGCQTPATRSDIDHTLDYAFGGLTSTENLGALCRRHHTLKHQTPWKVTQSARGVYEWTSPAGQRTRTEPRRRVRFQEIPAPPDPPERLSTEELWALDAAPRTEAEF